METYRVTLITDRRPDDPLALPLAPISAARRDDGSFEVCFDVEAGSFDQAAGQLWGEAAACGLTVIAVLPERRFV